MDREVSGSGLGFKLISVSIVLTAIAALIVGIFVTKLSEDEEKERLFHEVERVAKVAKEVKAKGDEGMAGLPAALLAAKLDEAGSAWILDAEGNVVVNLDESISGGAPLGDKEIKLTQVRQSLSEIGEKDMGNSLPLRQVYGKYQSGYGIITKGEFEQAQDRVVAFLSMPKQGWLVFADQPVGALTGITSALKRYILLAIIVLGIAVIVSTAVSISFIIQPYYRSQMAMADKIASSNRNLKKLHEVTLGMQKHLDLDKRIQDILNAARDVAGLDRIFIFLPDYESKMLQCRGAVGNEEEPIEEIRVPMGISGGAIARAFNNKEICRVSGDHVSEGLRLKPPYSEIKALRSRDFVTMPLIVENDCVGVVAADNQLSKIPINREKIEGIELFVNQAAIAIKNANMYSKLREHADKLEITDHLTKTFTFDHFKHIAEEEVSKVGVTSKGLAMGGISLINFAEYNRITGHNSGDAVLTKVAEMIKKNTMEAEIVGRCFGSTFGILFTGPSASNAEEHMKVIFNDLSKERFFGEERLEKGRMDFVMGVMDYDPKAFASVNDFISKVLEKVRNPAV